MPFGTHHEWGRLREVVIGNSPARSDSGVPLLRDDGTGECAVRAVPIDGIVFVGLN
jgi:hypothetical protein